MMEMDRKENILGTEAIAPLISKMSIPLMLSMLIQALYNIVDSIYVSRVSESALTAVSLAFPMQNLMISVAIGTAVGVNSLLSRRLGERNVKDATKAAHTGLFLAIVNSVAFALIGIFLSRPFFSLFTSDAVLLDMATTYLTICLTCSFGIFIDITSERIMQGTGDAFHPMIIQSCGAIINILLDPLFIFTFGMGVTGAAVATIIGQLLSMVLAIYYVRKDKEIEIHIRLIRPNKRIAKEIYQVGLPAIIMQSIGTVMVSAINGILIAFSATAVSVFGIFFKLQSFVFMPVFGLNSGIIPILGYNYGAGRKDRMTLTLKEALVVALIIMGLGTMAFELFPEMLLSFFAASEQMMEIGVPALRIIAPSFVFAAISIVLGASFQATGWGIASMIVSIGRQLVVLIPSAFILSHFIGINGVWYSFLIAECMGLILTLLQFSINYNKRIRNLVPLQFNGTK